MTCAHFSDEDCNEVCPENYLTANRLAKFEKGRLKMFWRVCFWEGTEHSKFRIPEDFIFRFHAEERCQELGAADYFPELYHVEAELIQGKWRETEEEVSE